MDILYDIGNFFTKKGVFYILNQLKDQSNDSRRKSFIVNVCYWAIIAAIIYLGVKYALPVLFPFLAGGAIAWFLNKPINNLSAKTPIPRSIISVAVVLLFYAAFVILIIFIIAKAAAGANDGVSSLSDYLLDSVLPTLEDLLIRAKQFLADLHINVGGDNFASLSESVKSGVLSLSSVILEEVANVAAKIPSFFANIVITIIVTVFFSVDFDNIKRFVLRQLPEKGRSFVYETKAFFKDILLKYAGAYLLIMFITFLELLAGFSILRISHALPIAAVTAVVDILPVLGTGTVLIPWAVVSIIMGNWFRGIGLLVLYGVITVIRNIMEPRLVGKQIGLHPLVTFFGIIIGIRLFGITGMIGVPLSFAFIRYLNERGVIHVFQTEEAE
jgi:sporulation integral membrane protein YtvI